MHALVNGLISARAKVREFFSGQIACKACAHVQPKTLVKCRHCFEWIR